MREKGGFAALHKRARERPFAQSSHAHKLKTVHTAHKKVGVLSKQKHKHTQAAHLKAKHSSNAMEKAFHDGDHDHDGQLSIQELKQVYTRMPQGVDSASVQELLADMHRSKEKGKEAHVTKYRFLKSVQGHEARQIPSAASASQKPANAEHSKAQLVDDSNHGHGNEAADDTSNALSILKQLGDRPPYRRGGAH